MVVAIQWLVSGDSLEIALDPDDGISIVGRFDNGAYAFGPFDWTVDDDVEALHATAIAAGNFLEKISTEIQHRLPVR